MKNEDIKDIYLLQGTKEHRLKKLCIKATEMQAGKALRFSGGRKGLKASAILARGGRSCIYCGGG